VVEAVGRGAWAGRRGPWEAKKQVFMLQDRQDV